jgi:putative PIN family toxin of toxin-antitoxin system
LRVFLDTNVLVSAFISRGISAEIFRIIVKEHDLIIGDLVLIELKRILHTKLKMPLTQVNNILNYLKSFEQINYSGEKSTFEIRDKDDENILVLALKSNSDVLITGDKDFLDVRKTLSIKVLNPREFLKLVKST